MSDNFTKKVLIVDKDPISRKNWKLILRRMGFHGIVNADDGEQAITHCQDQLLTLIIVDCNLPGMTSLDLVRFIRQDDTLHKVPVLLTVSESESMDLVEAVKAGINGYVTKPFSKHCIQQKIDAVFSNLSSSSRRNSFRSTTAHCLKGNAQAS